MTSLAQMSVEELATHVAEQLRRRGIDAVLTGGTCVTIYSRNRYASYDLDFIETPSVPRNRLVAALSEIGFVEKNRYFTHPDTPFFIEFPPGPLSIGAEPVSQIHEMENEFGTLRLLSPTDCVKDRLAAFYHWGDRQCLAQAVWVSREQSVDWEELRRWSLAEGKGDDFETFLKTAQDDTPQTET